MKLEKVELCMPVCLPSSVLATPGCRALTVTPVPGEERENWEEGAERHRVVEPTPSALCCEADVVVKCNHAFSYLFSLRGNF